jgi:Putative zinc-finger
MTTATHPAGSLEFLSRLHDGELSPSERQVFDAHVAGCDECREAVAAFEKSLDAFRAARVAPAPSDLSARILRKIRAQSPSRRPFGVMFGIDIRWAGVFLAALLVVIIAPALFERRETPSAAAVREPLTAYVVDAEADKAEAAPEARARAKADKKPLPRAEAPEAKENERARAPETRDEFAQAPPPPAAPAASAPSTVGGAVAQRPQLEAGSRSEESPQAGARNAVPPRSVARRSATATDKVGGETGSLAKVETPPEDIHLDVRSLDSDGRAPEIVQTPSAERLLPLRGRDFVLIVEADGIVRGVLPAARPDAQDKLAKDTASEAGASEAPLREVRFRATGKARRVLLQIH